jgi:hypothetical protein
LKEAIKQKYINLEGEKQILKFRNNPNDLDWLK